MALVGAVAAPLEVVAVASKVVVVASKVAVLASKVAMVALEVAMVDVSVDVVAAENGGDGALAAWPSWSWIVAGAVRVARVSPRALLWKIVFASAAQGAGPQLLALAAGAAEAPAPSSSWPAVPIA